MTITASVDAISSKVLFPNRDLRQSLDDLESVRRIDWRFLLPNPSLERVLYVGPASGALFVSLKKFSSLLVVLDPTEIAYPREEASFDVVVGVLPSTVDLKSLSRWLKPGGYLYAELHSSPISATKGRVFGTPWFKTVAAYQAELMASGFERVRSYWHRPTFETCLEIVPLDNVAVMTYARRRARADLLGRIRITAKGCLLKTGLLPHWSSCRSLVARRSGGKEPV